MIVIDPERDPDVAPVVYSTAASWTELEPLYQSSLACGFVNEVEPYWSCKYCPQLDSISAGPAAFIWLYHGQAMAGSEPGAAERLTKSCRRRETPKL